MHFTETIKSTVVSLSECIFSDFIETVPYRIVTAISSFLYHTTCRVTILMPH